MQSKKRKDAATRQLDGH